MKITVGALKRMIREAVDYENDLREYVLDAHATAKASHDESLDPIELGIDWAFRYGEGVADAYFNAPKGTLEKIATKVLNAEPISGLTIEKFVEFMIDSFNQAADEDARRADREDDESE